MMNGDMVMKAEKQKTPLYFCAFKYYPHICSAKNILRNVIRTAGFGQCSRNTMGFFYVHT